MALAEKRTKSLTVGPVMVSDGLPSNPADTLRTAPLQHRTFPITPPGRPFEKKEVVNLYRRNEPSPEDYCEPRPEDEGSVGAEKFGPQMKPPVAMEKTTQGQPIRGTC